MNYQSSQQSRSLAVLFNQKRQISQQPNMNISANATGLFIKFYDNYLQTHTLLNADLELEQRYLKKVGISLNCS